MFSGGNATIFVRDFETSLAFYTDTLGLPLRMRAGNFWAEVVAGKDLVIGIHPSNPDHAEPGTHGAVEIGLIVDEPLETIIERLTPLGVEFTGEIHADPNAQMRFQYLRDPDGNVLYLWEQPCEQEAAAKKTTSGSKA